MNKYDTATITNVRRGKGTRSNIIYANLVAADGELLIAATLDYIVEALAERMTSETA
jgi:hypothetical protein